MTIDHPCYFAPLPNMTEDALTGNPKAALKRMRQEGRPDIISLEDSEKMVCLDMKTFREVWTLAYDTYMMRAIRLGLESAESERLYTPDEARRLMERKYGISRKTRKALDRQATPSKGSKTPIRTR
jgi:hypothetical protein